MALPVIPAGSPTVVLPSVGQTYDRYWLKDLVIHAKDPSKRINVLAVLHKAGIALDGSTVLSLVDGDVTILLPDLFAAAAAMDAIGDHTLSQAMAAVLDGIVAYANFKHVNL